MLQFLFKVKIVNLENIISNIVHNVTYNIYIYIKIPSSVRRT